MVNSVCFYPCPSVVQFFWLQPQAALSAAVKFSLRITQAKTHEIMLRGFILTSQRKTTFSLRIGAIVVQLSSVLSEKVYTRKNSERLVTERVVSIEEDTRCLKCSPD